MSARPSPGTPSGSHEPRTARSSRPDATRPHDARTGTSRPGPATPVASRPVTASPAARPEPAMPARPSTVQIVASVLTAVTSTVALSYLGVAGTLVGAAVAAILTAFANYAYTRSLVRTQVVVTQLAPRYLRTPASAPDDVTDVIAAVDAEPAPGLTEPTVTTGVIPAVAAPEVAIVTRETPVVVPLPPPAGAPEVAEATSEGPPTAVEDGRALMAAARRSPRRTFGVVAVTSFVVIVLTLTVVELGLGRPLAKALQGVEGSGTTITTVRTRPTTPVPVEPSVPATTQEPSEAPTTGPSPEPTEAPTDAPTETPTDTPTDTPTEPVPTGTPEPVPTDAPAPTFPGQTGTPVPTAPAPQDGAELTGTDLTGASEGGASGDVTDVDEPAPVPTPPTG